MLVDSFLPCCNKRQICNISLGYYNYVTYLIAVIYLWFS